MPFCKILLTPLITQQEKELGYSKAGLKSLVGQTNFQLSLPFNRRDFVQNKPVKQKGMSISGYQPKIQLIIVDNQFDSIDAKGNYILKPSPEEYPHLAENEHATMRVMRYLGFDVPANGLFPFKSKEQKLEYTFVIKRFDRTADGKPIHQEQLDAAMGISDKYGKQNNLQTVSYERAIKFILGHVENNLIQQTDLFRRVVYAYLLGNNDLHLRNFSLIYDKTNRVRLAPVYDFVSVIPYPTIATSYLALPLLEKEEQDRELAHGFNTQYGQYIGQDFIEFGERIGLNYRLIIEKLFPKIQKEKGIVEKIYSQSFMPKADIENVLKTYHQRLALLQIIDEPEI